MGKITVYRFKKFDIIKGESLISPSYASLEKIKEFQAVALTEHSIEIEEAMLDWNGMYKPKQG